MNLVYTDVLYQDYIQKIIGKGMGGTVGSYT